MALRTCRDCNSPVSTSAKACPQCGARPPKEGLGCSGTIYALLIFLGIGATLASIEEKNNASNLAISTPLQACEAMESLGMAAGEWKSRYDEEYGCSSPYKDIGTAIPLPNNIAFYGEGTSQKVTKVKLVLNLNDPKNATAAINELKTAASLLTKKFTNTNTPQQITNAISEKKAASQRIENSIISVQPIDWPTGGYEIHVVIK